MPLYDHETEEGIINPYFTIYNQKGNWVAINMSTLGKDYASLLLTNYDDENIRLRNQDKLFKIATTIGEKSNPHSDGVSAMGANDALSVTFLGYLPKPFIESRLPKSFEYLTRKK